MIAFLIILSLFAILIGLGVYMGHRLLHPHRVSPESAFQMQLANGEISEEFVKRDKFPFRLKSDFGYELTGFYFKGDGDKTVIFCHGISWNKLGSAKYLSPFFEENWNIILYDHRGAGESGKAYPSFGYYEKFDLQKVKEFAKSIFPNTKVWGLFGESMGGATVMQYSIMDNEINFIVAVCPFSDLEDLMYYHLKKVKVPRIFRPIIVYISKVYIYIKAKFKVSDVTPAKDICNTKIPLYLSHGDKDLLVPYEMSLNLKEKREKLAFTLFFTAKGSGHTPYLYTEHKEEFEQILKNFLELYPEI